jgi:diaminohydroxyphosphoribosylaminopyrimidine deaminase / 5-amino-6-(5-phosphoribosylamino)uracil reductase
VRQEGLENRSPLRVVLSRHPGEGGGPDLSKEELDPGFRRDDVWIADPSGIATLPCDHLLVEGGAQTAAALLRADLVDRLLLYRAPILIGAGKASLGDIGLTDLTDAHGRWTLSDARMLGTDRLEVYVRQR